MEIWVVATGGVLIATLLYLRMPVDKIVRSWSCQKNLDDANKNTKGVSLLPLSTLNWSTYILHSGFQKLSFEYRESDVYFEGVQLVSIHWSIRGFRHTKWDNEPVTFRHETINSICIFYLPPIPQANFALPSRIEGAMKQGDVSN